jgi:hypothetical protein
MGMGNLKFRWSCNAESSILADGTAGSGSEFREDLSQTRKPPREAAESWIIGREDMQSEQRLVTTTMLV